MGYWKAKPLNTRFQDTCNFIEAEMRGTPDLDLSMFVMGGQIEAMSANGSLEGVVSAMSLGSRWDIRGRDAETRRRHFVRAVLLHELSHLFCRTEDHAYGKAGCMNLAARNPAMAAANADNHEYYAEEIMRDA